MTDTRHSLKSELLTIYIVIVSIFVFYVLTIRDGHVWGGDFALYIQHALNLINGDPYTKSGYIVNPKIPWISPSAYPPIFPYILAPVVKFFGMNLYSFKISLITIFCISLILLHRLTLMKLNTPWLRVFLVVLIGLSPWYWDYKDHILSELPFILFFISFLLLTENYLKHSKLGVNGEIAYSISIGLLAYLAYGCRSIGIILIPVFVTAYLFYKRKLSLALIISGIIFLILYLIQNNILNTDASYSNMVSVLETEASTDSDDKLIQKGTFIRYIIDNLTVYFFNMERFWENGYALTIRIVTIIITSILFVTGLFRLIKRQNISEIMVISYVGLLIIVPFNQGNRYLLPFIPFYLLYILKGIEELPLYFSKPIAKRLSLLTVALISFSFLGNTVNRDYSDFQFSVTDQNAKSLYSYIKNNLKKSDIVAFRKPRILSLYTQVHSFSYDYEDSHQLLWKNFQQLGANYILIFNTGRLRYSENILKLLELHHEKIKKIFENKDFTLYQLI